MSQPDKLEAMDLRRTVDIGQLLHEIAHVTAPRRADLARAGREIHLEVDAARGLLVAGWSHPLRAAVANLVSNALDALPSGGTIRLQARRERERVVVEVADDGVGMPAEVEAHCLEPFFTTKVDASAGLGLAQVKAIVARHAGTFQLTSREHRGTVARLEFDSI